MAETGNTNTGILGAARSTRATDHDLQRDPALQPQLPWLLREGNQTGTEKTRAFRTTTAAYHAAGT